MRETMQYNELNEYLSKYFKLKSRVNTVLVYTSDKYGFYYRLKNTNNRHENIYYLVEVDRVEGSSPTEYFCLDAETKGYYIFDNNIHKTFIRPGDTEHYCIKKADCTYKEYVEPLTLPFDDKEEIRDDLQQEFDMFEILHLVKEEKNEEIVKFFKEAMLRSMHALISKNPNPCSIEVDNTVSLAIYYAEVLTEKIYTNYDH